MDKFKLKMMILYPSRHFPVPPDPALKSGRAHHLKILKTPRIHLPCDNSELILVHKFSLQHIFLQKEAARSADLFLDGYHACAVTNALR